MVSLPLLQPKDGVNPILDNNLVSKQRTVDRRAVVSRAANLESTVKKAFNNSDVDVEEEEDIVQTTSPMLSINRQVG
jgi:hypothetical protein